VQLDSQPQASDEVYQLLAHGQWFSPTSSTTKTGRHDIAEILLKVALNNKNHHHHHHKVTLSCFVHILHFINRFCENKFKRIFK
jgi:hypothetical protein